MGVQLSAVSHQVNRITGGYSRRARAVGFPVWARDLTGAGGGVGLTGTGYRRSLPA
jgi:hypothetical protein